MSYEVLFDEKTIDFLNTLPRLIKERIYNRIINAKSAPAHYFERLESREEYKLRIGDYRAIADIDNKNKKIMIRKIGHRKNIYEKT